MPKVNVTRPIQLGLGFGKRDLKPSANPHVLTEEEMNGWYIPSLIETGAIVILGQPSISPEPANVDFVYEEPAQQKIEKSTEEPIKEEIAKPKFRKIKR